MEFITNVLANPMSPVIVFGVMWTMYYIEKNYLTQPMTTANANIVNSKPTMQDTAVEAATEVETIAVQREAVLQEA